ncbi:Baseplate J family protein [Acetobacter tropicalis NBRC 101654]|uniref:Baseplate J family protein n=1 Tax=Acetobacter tropicalis NBRC 101654 TaxID=749388 RepID=F7VH44_9PROT|nr:baseplate J/gp47 family protein [Acetobacter tropicalis]GAA09689.1 Baseplate J family protein [Acetobacter tropicalis NBRC 101654]
MAYSQPTYSTIKSNLVNQLNAQIGVKLLPQSVIMILAVVLAKLINLMYGYLNYIEQQGVPFTATDLTLEAWGSLKNITRKTAAYATGSVTFTGSDSTQVIPAGTVLSRPDGTQFTTNTATNINESVLITAVDAGANSNTSSGTVLTLNSSFVGVDGTVTLQNSITSGSDMETDSALRERVIAAFQETPSGGSVEDHERWALAAGANYAWTNPTPLAGNEVVTYVMFDRSNAYQGFPQGTDGSATGETRWNTATGDQLTIADGIYSSTPVGEISIIAAPKAQAVNIVINGLSNLTSAEQASIKTALENLFINDGTPLGTTIYVTAISAAIQQIVGSQTFTLSEPTENIQTTLGNLATLGTITYNS